MSAISIKGIIIDEEYHKEFNKRDPLYKAFDNFLSKLYPIKLAEVCRKLDEDANKQPNKDMALARAIEAFFNKKSYDFDYYYGVANKCKGYFGENIIYYKKYTYRENNETKIGYHTPNDKKVILIEDDKMICDGCANLVEDIIDYCNKNYGYTIGHRKDTDNQHKHAWNVITIDGIEYKFDMSKCYHDRQTYFEPLTKTANNNLTIKKFTPVNQSKNHITHQEIAKLLLRRKELMGELDPLYVKIGELKEANAPVSVRNEVAREINSRVSEVKQIDIKLSEYQAILDTVSEEKSKEKVMFEGRPEGPVIVEKDVSKKNTIIIKKITHANQTTTNIMPNKSYIDENSYSKIR